MNLDDLDVSKLTSEQRDQLKKKIEEYEADKKNPYKNFRKEVIDLVITKKLDWGKVLKELKAFKPQDDAEAKKLGYSAKKGGEYYLRQVSGSEVL